jgi:molybdate transport system ATP-binding protein
MLQLDLHKSLQGAQGPLALHFSDHIAWGDCLALHGPSGAGKTSILRMVAGLLAPDAGSIHLDGVVWRDSRISLPPQVRRCGVVFQQYALFPRMRVRAQLQYAQAEHNAAEADRLLAELGLIAIADRLPVELSGGQQQRVAFARALASRPRLLLLDEPFSAQDAAHAQAMHTLLQAYRADTRCICLLVTHATADVLRLADRVALLDQGQIVALDSPDAVFRGDPSAEVIALRREGDQWRATLLVEGRLSTHTLAVADFPGLQVGMRLPFSMRF